MSIFGTTKMTTKGQVVIPEEIRTVLDLAIGDKFIVSVVEDVIIFKKLAPTPQKELKRLLKKAQGIEG